MLHGGGKPEQRPRGTESRESEREVRARQRKGSLGVQWGKAGGGGAGPGAPILPAVYVGGTVSLKKSGQGRDTVGLEGGWGALCLLPGKEGPWFFLLGVCGP